MKTIINIGTTRGNITNVPFDCKFTDISYEELMEVVRKEYPEGHVKIIGWAKIDEIKTVK